MKSGPNSKVLQDHPQIAFFWEKGEKAGKSRFLYERSFCHSLLSKGPSEPTNINVNEALRQLSTAKH